MGLKKPITKTALKEALQISVGNQTKAGALLGRTRQTIAIYIKKYDLVEFVDELKNVQHDNLAGKAYEEAMNGNTALLIFLLKTQHGYKETSQIESDNKVEIVVRRTDED